VTAGDRDGNGIPDLMVKFPAEAVVATLPDNRGVVIVSGAFKDGTEFEGYASLLVIARGHERNDNRDAGDDDDRDAGDDDGTTRQKTAADPADRSRK
jgi:hypothetical protein